MIFFGIFLIRKSKRQILENSLKKRKKKTITIMYALSDISTEYLMWSVYAKTEWNGSRTGNAPEQIESESEDHNAREIKSRRAGCDQQHVSWILKALAWFTRFAAGGSRGDTAFHDTRHNRQSHNRLREWKLHTPSVTQRDDYSSIFTRPGRWLAKPAEVPRLLEPTVTLR